MLYNACYIIHGKVRFVKSFLIFDLLDYIWTIYWLIWQ